ncbi:hypothetical protein E2C01_030462 [Portunus trituberculatus]|uniref:G-protein coupled receptors family 1 profile domain-containing protein n=1 Tax=Portunus trituberculatus TaxID=210409 RepID=A0A5B7EVD7_PORTR|nr:hypothetical protein [Portunus trituberculatus]
MFGLIRCNTLAYADDVVLLAPSKVKIVNSQPITCKSFANSCDSNLVVLLVMWVHPRMRSTTNFFLTNLAIADFCVTVFCVYQNLSLYLAQT